MAMVVFHPRADVVAARLIAARMSGPGGMLIFFFLDSFIQFWPCVSSRGTASSRKSFLRTGMSGVRMISDVYFARPRACRPNWMSSVSGKPIKISASIP